jgi:hypothetical protein
VTVKDEEEDNDVHNHEEYDEQLHDFDVTAEATRSGCTFLAPD